MVNCKREKTDNSLMHTLNANGEIMSLINLPDGYVATGSDAKSIQIWNIQEGILERTLQSSAFLSSYGLALLQDKLLLSVALSGLIETWNLNDGLLIMSMNLTDNHTSTNCVTALTNGHVAIATDIGVFLVNLFTEEALNKWPNIEVHKLIELDKDLLAVLLSCGCQIKILNILTGEIIQNFSDGTALTNMVVLSNKLLAIGTMDGRIIIWNPYTKNLIKTFKGHETEIISLDVLKNGNLLSSGFDNMIKVWNSKHEFELESFNFNAVELSSVTSNGYLVNAFRSSIYIWDVEKFNKEMPASLKFGKN